MEIGIRVPSLGKTATLEVESDDDVASIVEVLCQELGLGDSRKWSLAYGGRALENSKKLGELRVRDLDRIEMVETQTEKPNETRPRSQPQASAKQVKLETTFVAEHKCSCGKELKWISEHGRLYCYRCKRYPPQCSTCKKDLFWVSEYRRYYCNTCGSYASKTIVKAEARDSWSTHMKTLIERLTPRREG